MSLSAEQVLSIVQAKGPIIPNKIKQELEQGDSTLINVYLSELKAEGKVKQTFVKLGTSSFFYTPDQRAKLATLVEHTNEKQQRALAKLKANGVVRASQEDPVVRVSLQDTPDFSIAIQVKTGSGEETFFRWFLLSPAEAQEKIKSMMGVKKPKPKAPEKPVVKNEPPKPTPKPVEKPKEKPVAKPQEAAVKPQETATKPQEKQTALASVEATSGFTQQLVSYCEKKNIKIVSMKETRKDKEVDLEIELPTPVGSVAYFCRAKKKKSSNDGDIASTILAAKSRMLPAMYITTGTVTKKAKKNPELQECVVVEWA